MTYGAAVDGETRQQIGLFTVEMNAQIFLETMRSQARQLARQYGHVTTDDLREYADSLHLEPHHHNAWGAVFKTKEFRCTGFVKSRLPSNRARMIRQWALA